MPPAPPPTAFTLPIPGISLQALPDRALLWTQAGQRTLIVADVHLGKGAAFRRAGVAVPSGASQADLDRLEALIAAHAPQRLLVLGDLLHTAVTAAEPLIAAFAAFRARQPDLVITAVRGNHDRRIERLPPAWRIDWVEEALREPPFRFVHELEAAGAESESGPEAGLRNGGEIVVAGHLHPVLRLRAAGDALRLPVFWLQTNARRLVLPAFGSFTGGWPVQPAREDTVIGVTPDGLVSLQSGQPLSPTLSSIEPCTS